MSSNLSVINFAVGGTLTISGKTTLAETILSSSTASFQGVSTTSLTTTGTSTFTSLPTSTQIPTLDSQLTTKIYVDTADSTQKLYIDDADTVLNNRITSVDNLRKTYVDDADTVLNNRITSVDNLRKTYVDDADTVLNNRITSVDNLRKTYVDDGDKVLDTKINTYGKKGYYIQYDNKTYVANDFGFSQFIELRPRTGQFTFYTTFLPNPTTCAGQIVYIWNNTIEDQGVDQTGDNLFIRNVENRVSIFIRTKTIEMFVSIGNNWLNLKGPVLQD
jgi:hypothetical protein